MAPFFQYWGNILDRWGIIDQYFLNVSNSKKFFPMNSRKSSIISIGTVREKLRTSKRISPLISLSSVASPCLNSSAIQPAFSITFRILRISTVLGSYSKIALPVTKFTLEFKTPLVLVKAFSIVTAQSAHSIHRLSRRSFSSSVFSMLKYNRVI